MKLRDIKLIDTIYVHHSASRWGTAEDVKGWHLERGWSDIGYSSVIENCYPTFDSLKNDCPVIENDGKTSQGRELKYKPAGVKGKNETSVHICLIGTDTFTSAQLLSLRAEIRGLIAYLPSIKYIKRHADDDATKPDCPNLSTAFLESLTA